MRKLLTLFFLLPLAVTAQKYTLIDRHFKKPIVQTDSLAHRYDGHFILYTEDLNKVMAIVEKFSKNYQLGLQPDVQAYIEAGHSNFIMYKEKDHKHFGLQIILNTRTENKGTSLELVDERDGNRVAQQKLLIFLDYLRNNRVLMQTAALHTQ